MLAYYGGFWETWYSGFKVYFDGHNKIIKVNEGVTDINVQRDLYSAWKSWATYSENENLSFQQAFRTFGGDPTVQGQVAPQYFFLMNGWRILVDGQHVEFASNLYTDEGVSPFILGNGGTISNKTADVPTIGGATPEEIWGYVSRELTVAAGLTPDQVTTMEQILSEVQSIECSSSNTNEWVISI